jgi:hypothetical protein
MGPMKVNENSLKKMCAVRTGSGGIRFIHTVRSYYRDYK